MAETWKRCRLLGNSHAEVYLAADKITGNLFVVKTTDTQQRTATAELLNEISIFLMLNSPRVVQYLGSSFTEDGDKTKLNLFVEYMPGGTLRHHITRLGPSLTEPLIRTYTRTILEALYHLHSHGIVHGDIKSDNILVGLYEIKLADFGGSKLVGVKKPMKGTCAWMAPEVVIGVEQGPASDIWSLGCTILEMATGLDPWPNIPHDKLLRRVIQHSTLVPAIPQTLSDEGQAFLRKCLVRDPTKRPTTGQLLEDSFLNITMPNPTSTIIPAASKAPVAYPSIDDGELSDHPCPRRQIPSAVQFVSNCGQDERLTTRPEATFGPHRSLPSSPDSRLRVHDSLIHQPLREGEAFDSMVHQPLREGEAFDSIVHQPLREGEAFDSMVHQPLREGEAYDPLPFSPDDKPPTLAALHDDEVWPVELDSLISLRLTKSEWDTIYRLVLNTRKADRRTRSVSQGKGEVSVD